MSYGLTPQGFVSKSVDEVRQELIDQLRGDISPSLDFGEDTLFGHIVGIVAEYIARGWDQAQGVYRAMYPDSATEDALDGIAALTGVTRLAAQPSRVVATVRGQAGTVLPPGRVASVAGTGARFYSLDQVTIGPSGEAELPMVSEQAGPISAPAGTLTEIETPVVGWEEVTNLFDAELGRNREKDEELRLRREQTLRAVGSGTFESLRAALLLLPDVQQVRLFENTGMSVDAAGLPPKSFEAVIEGGEGTTLHAEIWRRKPAGIESAGSEAGEVIDSQGFAHVVRFSRPTPVPVYLAIKIKKGVAYPSDGADRIRAALVAYGQGLLIGEDVIAARLYPIIFGAASGVADVPELYLGTAPDPTTGANVAVGARGLAQFDSDRIEIVEVA